ncbi:MAG TPA: restriction endonuclease [Kofleriaceae bacterium]|nr:restriction endonuclease [Kofleriaceae bacterium]
MAKTDKTEKADKPSRAARADKAEKPRADKPKAAKPEKAEKADKPDRPEKGDKAPRAAAPRGKKPSEKTDRAEKPSRTRGEKATRPVRGKGRTQQIEPIPLPEGEPEPLVIETEATPTAGFVVDPAVEEAPPAAAEAVLADDDEDALHDRIVHEDELPLATEPPALSPEEQELAKIYGDELAAAPPAAAHGEFADRRTADEDRPMMPEINGRQERQKRWEERRDERRLRREQERQERQRRRGGGGGGGGAPGGERRDRPEQRGDNRDRFENRDRDRGGEGRGEPRAEPRAEGDRPAERAFPPPITLPGISPVGAAEPEAASGAGVIRVGNELGDAAWAVFSSIRGAQPMPVRQLAGMMRKRGLLDNDPEQAWPHLKAALIGDERSYRSLGLRPRIVYRGRDLFGPGPAAQGATAAAEGELARALSAMAVATHRTLKARVAAASQAGFERLAHAYLVSAGFRDIAWIKQVEGISYATALPPDGSTTVLVSARSGDTPVDRRGVGELRVGVEAKGLLAGYLLAARELSAEAERELERPGRSLTMLVGDSFVSALLAAGIGVVTAAAPVRYVDEQLLGELLAG